MMLFPNQWKRVFLGALLIALHVSMQAYAINDAAWKKLTEKVDARKTELISLIDEANRCGLSTDYASVSIQVISAFQKAARHDRDHVEEVRRIFQTFNYYSKTDPAEADRLAENELNACLQVAGHAIAELRRQLDGKITLSKPPDFSHGSMKLADAYYRLDDRIVFPSSLIWMPKEEGFMQAFGRIGESFYQLTDLREDGRPSERALNSDLTSIKNQYNLDAAPFVFFMGHAPAGWMTRLHPEIVQGARHFTQYDIDSLLVRDWIKKLCAGLLPEMSNACGDRPLIHLLANEPHFATQKGGWRANNGLSKHSMRKYRKWIADKYKTVDALNHAYGASYKNLEQVNIKIPVNPSLRGTAIWYDWCRFNMDRVNDWFTFLKKQVQKHSRSASPVTIKMLGFTLSTSLRDHGLDIEYLTNLQDMPGADLRVAPHDAIFYGKREEGLDPEAGWRSRYAYDWVEQSMYLDFTKSICPDKLFYDSEWHGFGAVSWRHFKLNRAYVRSALWLAFSHGMGAIKPWLWGRSSNGALRASADHIGELATQPVAVDAYGRTLKELNAHAEDVVAAVPQERQFMIYYCEEAAIQDKNYTQGFKDIYGALKLLNLTVGFTTPSTIGRLNPKKQVLIISPTPFIADKSLARVRDFQKRQGRLVLVGGEGSFLKNEKGVARSDAKIEKPFASIPQDDATRMITELKTILNPIQSATPIKISISNNAGEEAYGVIVSQFTSSTTGEITLLLNNVSKEDRIITLRPNTNRSQMFMNVISHQVEKSKFVMKSRDVRLLKIME